MKKEYGFSILELLVALAIIAILSSIAIPSYKNYINKAKLSEIMSIAEGQKLKILDLLTGESDLKCQQQTGKQGKNFSKYIESITTWEKEGIYHIQLQSPKNIFSKNNFLIEFLSNNEGDITSWECMVQKEFLDLLNNKCSAAEIIPHKC